MNRISHLLMGLCLVLGLSSSLNAALCVFQYGDCLYVFGTRKDDSIRVSSDLVGRVRVIDNVTGDEELFFDIVNVYICTGYGNDDVKVDTRNGFNDGLNIRLWTGAGADSVELDTTNSGNDITVKTGSGDDSVLANMFSSNSFGGATDIRTGRGNDTVNMTVFDENLLVSLGRNGDTVSGVAVDSFGVVDGRSGFDTCSGLSISGGTLAVINCEN